MRKNYSDSLFNLRDYYDSGSDGSYYWFFNRYVRAIGDGRNEKMCI